MIPNRYTIKFTGQSGQGINTIGKILSKVLLRAGYWIFAYREYPSLIKGGCASYQIDFSGNNINSSSSKCDMLCVLDKSTLKEYIPSLRKGGLLIYDDKDAIIPQSKSFEEIYIDTTTLTKEANAPSIAQNVVMLSFIWKILGLDIKILKEEIKEYFEGKNIDMEMEYRCIDAGYNTNVYKDIYCQKCKLPKKNQKYTKKITLTGNEAMALGTISSGVRAYYAYPMTPITAIFKHLGDTAKQTGILLKQAESEITAVQMAMGSMYMGTRALVATSGGGFDLMTETISCSAMSETPLVIILGQRAGAGTGVPTWTGATDLNVALGCGHGEFERCVIAVNDVKTSYSAISKAFNIAEQYQIPVIILTEKQIAESIYSIRDIPKPEDIQRNISTALQRYTITKNGISPRRIPRRNRKPFLATSDEHDEDGKSTEDANIIKAMVEKRARKLEILEKELPQPTLYNPRNSETIFVGWGSVGTVIKDLISNNANFGYLEYEYIYPLKTEILETLIKRKKRLIIIENNYTGQLGKLIKEKIGYDFKYKLNKYNSKPFFTEDILEYLKTI
ncbi:MAG: 2-oxoacid:acceptor oxidoreductase subunit alpha [Candidatus Dojkabacteria bacterium]|nr:2-oxoacid:acceptor oxidoreductase subunit alpha [Candidatus Dojkabacteria bacterium]